MNLAGFYDESISNGLGWRAVVFVSGCPHHCIGCQNKIAQDFNYGETFEKEELIAKMKENSILKGVTLSGGEPLCKENVPEILDFVKSIRQEIPGFNIWCYTGYTMEELMSRNDEDLNECLKEIDVLVDGRFMQERKDPTLKFRGSSNQRIIDVKETQKKKAIKQIEL